MNYLKKSISIFLATLFMLQLLPMKYFGNLYVEALAAETIEIPDEYEFDIPVESDNTVDAVIPETFIDNNYTPLYPTSDDSIEESVLDDETVSTTSTSEEDGTNYSAYVSSPYAYKNNENESISLASGELTYRTTDYVLPGRNGFDLVIGRQFSSSDASIHKITPSRDSASNSLYLNLNHNVHFNSMYYLGHGWSFNFTSVEKFGGLEILHLSDGRSYALLSGSSASMVLSGQGKDEVRVIKYNETIEETGEEALYTVEYIDGTTEYLSSNGILLYKTDKFGNRIKFSYNSTVGFKSITIVDSLDRTTTISVSETDTERTVTVSLPDGNNLTYEIAFHDSGLEGISEYRDAKGNSTYYSYAVNTVQYKGHNSWTSMNVAMSLSTITHPTQAQTKFDCETVVREIGNGAYGEFSRIISRYDLEGTVEKNRVYYTYPEGEVDGFNKEYVPTESDYYIEAEYSSGLTIRNNFNEHNKISEQITSYNGTILEKQEYQYDLSFYVYYYNGYEIDKIYYETYPCKITTHKYSTDQTQIITTIENFEYDDCDRVKKSWSSLAEGDIDSTNYLTTYSYYYGFLKSKIFNINSNTKVHINNTGKNEKYITKSQTSVENIANGTTVVQTTDYTYDSYGNVLTEKTYGSDANSYILTEYSYQDGAYLIQEKHTSVTTSDGSLAVGTSGTADGIVTLNYTYNTSGRLASSTDGNGNRTSYLYDALGNITTIINPDRTRVTYTRDYINNFVIVKDEKGTEIKYTYTPLGLEYETIDVATGKVLTHKEYDSSSRLIKANEYIYGSVTEYTYDGLDRIT
ncbi:MAG: RHS repeat protein, partial [Oscillospiraceae bacterium]|nr:RHS repeat protein [Oscillospiraceae bacterium]